jgi:hypothetical protein
LASARAEPYAESALDRFGRAIGRCATVAKCGKAIKPLVTHGKAYTSSGHKCFSRVKNRTGGEATRSAITKACRTTKPKRTIGSRTTLQQIRRNSYSCGVERKRPGERAGNRLDHKASEGAMVTIGAPSADRIRAAGDCLTISAYYPGQPENHVLQAKVFQLSGERQLPLRINGPFEAWTHGGGGTKTGGIIPDEPDEEFRAHQSGRIILKQTTKREVVAWRYLGGCIDLEVAVEAGGC